jgi:hypothetical protein
MPAPRSPLQQALARGFVPGGDLHKELEGLSDYAVTTEDDARALVEAVGRLPAPLREEEPPALSTLHVLIGLFQSVESREAFDVLRAEGVPRLLEVFDDRLASGADDPGDLLFLLKVAAMYRVEAVVERVVSAVRRPVEPGSYMWSVIFGVFDEDHPYRLRLFHALRDPLPRGFVGVAYLDLANAVLREGHVSSHPFDTSEGKARLREFLTAADQASYAHSAAVALPFIGRPDRDGLLALAMDHPSVDVPLEAARVAGKLGSDSALRFLSRACLDPRSSKAAVAHLNELGQGGLIPAEALEADFQALSEMVVWLSHPNEFGRAPDAIDVVDTRELFWPPTGDRRDLWLVRYRFEPNEPGESAAVGVGLVGSITFALSGEAAADLPPEDLYALYCCWELQVRKDPRAPEERTVEAGRALLLKHNGAES